MQLVSLLLADPGVALGVQWGPMALTATMYHIELGISDVARSVYESAELRVARHPSENLRYMLTRTLAYALSYEDGIAFSKGGLSAVDEPPLSIIDPTGILLAWIDVGAPSAERLHKASKLARRVALFTHVELHLLLREAATRAIHKVEAIEVFRFAPSMLAELEAKIERRFKLDVTRTEDDQLYLTCGNATIEGAVERHTLVAQPASSR
jgi:uncharacterized protein YaeQ